MMSLQYLPFSSIFPWAIGISRCQLRHTETMSRLSVSLSRPIIPGMDMRSKRWPILRLRTLAWGPCISDFFRFLQSFTARPGAHPCSTLGVRRFHIYIYLMIQNPMTSNDILSLEPPRKPETSFVVWPSVFFLSGLHEGFALPIGLHPCAANYWY